MKRFLLLFIPLFMGCGTIREIPVETVEKIVVRDSMIYVCDSIEVPVPYEVIREIVPQDTVSILNTSIASSTAKVEKGMLSHSLEQKGTLKTQIDTFYVTKYVEKIKEVEVPIEIQVEKKYIPEWCWWCLIYAIILTL